jgi:hypothetical protein
LVFLAVSLLLASPPITCVPLLPHSCYMPCPFHPPRVDHSNYTSRRVRVTKLLMQFSSPSCNFIPLRSFPTAKKRHFCTLPWLTIHTLHVMRYAGNYQRLLWQLMNTEMQTSWQKPASSIFPAGFKLSYSKISYKTSKR